MKISKSKILSLIDLTSLNDDENEDTIKKLCADAVTIHGNVAAVCIYPKFIKTAKTLLKETPVKIATVCNFPSGNQNIDTVLKSIELSINDGANEIDVVIPYKDYLSGKPKTTIDLIKKSKNICGKNILLKVILETGILDKPSVIKSASLDAINAGADFLKTSSGKVNINATLKAAEIMLSAINESKAKVGFKASGGIRTLNQSLEYLETAEQIMGTKWISPKTFRFGTSRLLHDIISH